MSEAMSEATPNLLLPFLQSGQAQKHVTVNESLRKLDAVVQLAVVSATTTAEPASPADGAVYIVPSGKTGTHWAGFTDWALAYWRDGAWEQIAPREGWIAYVRDSDLLQVYAGSAWSQATLRTALGLGTAAVKNTGASGDAVPLLNAGFSVAGAVAASDGFTMGGGRLRMFAASLADDAATSFDVNPNSGGFAMLSLTAAGTGALMIWDSAGTYELAALMEKETYAPIDQTTGALSGTTGADNRVTVSIHTDNRLYLENRSGGAIAFRFFILDA